VDIPSHRGIPDAPTRALTPPHTGIIGVGSVRSFIYRVK